MTERELMWGIAALAGSFLRTVLVTKFLHYQWRF